MTTAAIQLDPEIALAWALQEARTRYESYIAVTAPHLILSPTHRRLCRLLDDVVHFRKRRVIISCPPRFGKSEFAVRRFIPYAFGVDPKLGFMLTANQDKLVDGFSKAAQLNMGEDTYHAIFPGVEVDPYRSAVGNWCTLQGGNVLTFGINSGINGFGCNILIVDDPLGNREQADSQAITEKIWETWQNTLYSRLDPIRNAILIIATRQSPNDLIGKLCAGETAGEWEVFSFPICDDDEESIFPERFSNEWIQAQKKAVGAREWQSQYLCRPYIKTDHSVDRNSWKWIAREKLPVDIRWCYGIDLATTTKTKSDRTSICRYGKDPRGNYYVDGGIMFKEGWNICKPILLRYIMNAPAPVGFEDVSGFKTAASELRDSLAGVCPVFGVPAQADKMSKAWAWISLHSIGKFFLVENPGAAKWYAELLYEAESFGSRSVKDDVLDSISVAHENSRRFGGAVKSGFHK